MGHVMLAIFIFMVTLFAICCAAFALIVWRLNKLNRVDPTMASPAPLFWLVSPSQSALLHRRLRAAAALVATAPKTGATGRGSLDDLHAQVIVQARELDRLVAITARAPRRIRRDHIRALRPQVTELENLSGRLMGLDQRSFGPRPAGAPVDPPEVALREMEERIAHLEHAEAELAAVERANGLGDPEAIIAEGQTSLPAPDPADRIPDVPAPGPVRWARAGRPYASPSRRPPRAYPARPRRYPPFNGW
jgi:hypothetical protein